MAVEFHCPCGRALVADEAHRGMEVRCPSCGRTLRVPSASEPAAVSPGLPSPSVCSHCGAALSPADSTCPKCGAFLETRAPSVLPGATAPSSPPPERPGLPWERRDEIGTWPAAFQTLKKVLFSPGEAFREMTLGSPLGGAFLFFVIFGCGGSIVGAIWGAIFQAAMMSFMLKVMPTPPSGASFNPAMMGTFQGILGIVLAPFFALIGLVVLSGLAHLGLLATGAKPKEFSVTMSVYAYGLGSAYVFQAFPFCGVYVALIWAMVCVVCGLIQVHRCETWKALLSALWPVLLCCCCVGVIFFVAMGAGMAHP